MTERAKEIVNMSAGTLIHLGLILSTIVLSFAVVKGQADNNSKSIVNHEYSDEKKWDKALEDIEDNTDDIHRIEVQNGRIESALSQILVRMDKGEANDQRILEKLDGLYNPEVRK